MRGSDRHSGSLFSYVNLEERVPARHPLRKIKTVVDAALFDLDADFATLYAVDGRPGIAPERLLRAALVQILFSIRSETQLMEQMQYNLLFRWFVGLSIDEPVWVPTVFTKNRDRLLNADIAKKLRAAILAHEKVAPLLSDDHFSVDGTLVEAWASFKSFKPKATGGGAEPPDGDPPPPDTGNASGTGTTDTTTKADTAGGASEMSQRAGHRKTASAASWRSHARLGGTSSATGAGRRGRTRRTPPSPIPTPASIARPRASRPSSATWATR
jgi:transposase